METIYFSKNAKLNNVLNKIHDSLLKIHDTEEESIEEIGHYKENFPKEPDFCLYQHGNLLIWNDDIRELYKEYTSLQGVSEDTLLNIYKRQVGYVANYILSKKSV
jgi:hypothetical protein